MRLQKLYVPALALALFVMSGSTNAGVVLPDGFNITVQLEGGGVWNATSNPEDFNVESGQDGALIWGESSTSNWDATWESINYAHNPSITTAFSFTNMTGATQLVTIEFNTPASFAGPSILHGSITGGLTDGNSNGATFDAPAGSAVYQGLIDGVAAGPSLFNDPHSVSTTPPTLTAPLGFESYTNELGGSVTSEIGIRHTFVLTAGDSVTFNTAFQVVPAPAALPMLALAGVMARRRRRR